jgi:hypothetical protein
MRCGGCTAGHRWLLPIIMIPLWLILAGCAHDSPATPAHALEGYWVTERGEILQYRADGTFHVYLTGVDFTQGTYTFDGTTLTTTTGDGGSASARVTLSASSLTVTTPDGSADTWQRIGDLAEDQVPPAQRIVGRWQGTVPGIDTASLIWEFTPDGKINIYDSGSLYHTYLYHIVDANHLQFGSEIEGQVSTPFRFLGNRMYLLIRTPVEFVRVTP